MPYAKELVAIGGLLSVLGGLAVIAGGERCGGAMLLLFLAPVRARAPALSRESGAPISPPVARDPCARSYALTLAVAVAMACSQQVSVVMHNFWSGPELDKDHMAHFLKNVALMGASLVLLFPHSSASASGKVKQQ